MSKVKLILYMLGQGGGGGISVLQTSMFIIVFVHHIDVHIQQLSIYTKLFK